MALRWLGGTVLKLTYGLALLALGAVTIFAVRSYWVQDLAQVAYQWYPTHDSYCARWLGMRSLRGTLSFSLVRNDYDLTRPESIVSNGNEPGWVDDFRKRSPEGFRVSYSTIPAAANQLEVNIFWPNYEHEDEPGQTRHDESWTLRIPSPYLMLALLVPAFHGYRVLRSRAKALQGLCANCGYDLRTCGGICPECDESRASTFYGKQTSERQPTAADRCH